MTAESLAAQGKASGDLVISTLDHRDAEVAKQIHHVWMAAYQVEAQLLEMEDFPPLQRTVEGIQQAWTRFIGLRVQGTLAAVAELREEAEECEICALVVHPDFHRRGFGRRLLGNLIFVEHPRRRLVVDTAEGNTPAIALYRQLGFQEERRWQRHDGIAMVRFQRTAAKDWLRGGVRALCLLLLLAGIALMLVSLRAGLELRKTREKVEELETLFRDDPSLLAVKEEVAGYKELQRNLESAAYWVNDGPNNAPIIRNLLRFWHDFHGSPPPGVTVDSWDLDLGYVWVVGSFEAGEGSPKVLKPEDLSSIDWVSSENAVRTGQGFYWLGRVPE